MTKWLEECRMLYNNFLGQRKDGWEQRKEKFSLYDQLNTLPKLKKTFPKLGSVYSQVLQNVGIRVDLAYQAFFRRVKRHEKPGYPRFKSYGRYDSFCYPTSVNVGFCEGTIKLPKLGIVPCVFHRKTEGNPKTVTVKRQHGKWYIFVVTDFTPHKNVDKSKAAVGIDVGIETFATLSDGEKIENPRFFETKQKDLAKAQRKLQKAKSSNAKPKVIRAARGAVGKVHEKIGNSRHNFIHQTTNSLIGKYSTLVVEDINTNSMIKKRWCNKQILDAAWASFINTLAHKAECAGRKFMKVNPAYTSQTCSRCGTRTLHELKDRIFNCSCGYSAHRDANASRNILTLGLQSLEAQGLLCAT